MDSLCHPYNFNLIRGLEIGGKQVNYNIIFSECSQDEYAKKKYLEYFSHNRVDGLILYGSFQRDNDVIAEFSKSGFPFVIIENDIPNVEANKVLIDNRSGSKIIVEHLFKKGYRDIRMVCWGNTTFAGRERIEGFKEGIKKCNLNIPDNYIYSSNTDNIDTREVSDIMEKILREKKLPDAFFFGSDEFAYAAMELCLKKGVKIPKDIAIAGFDNDVHFSREILFPRLTTIDQPLNEIGIEAIHMLSKQIENPKLSKRSVIFPVKLIEGETT
jgi:DNA-binding LacI/PurR family transcriptional regulator